MRGPKISLHLLAPLALLALCACSAGMRGNLARIQGEPESALGYYDEALRQEPDSVSLRMRVGGTCMDMGDYARAEASFRQVLALRPGQPEALFYLGLARIGKGEREAALRDLAAYVWPGKFLLSRAVREEAERLARHPDMPPKDTMRELNDALARGQKDQDELERDMIMGLSHS